MDCGFALYLGFAHFVQCFDRHPRIFGPVLHEDQLTTGFERAHDACQHLKRECQLVIDVDHDGQVNRSSRQSDIVFRAEQRLNLFQADLPN